MKESRELFEKKRKGRLGELFEPGPWDAIGKFDGKGNLYAEFYMKDEGFRVKSEIITTIDRLKEVVDTLDDYNNFFSEFNNGDYAIHIDFVPGTHTGDQIIRLPLKDATGMTTGKEFFLAIEKGGKKEKYRRKSQSIVSDQKEPPLFYLPHVLVSPI